MNIWKLSEWWNGPNNRIYFLVSLGIYAALYLILQHLGIFPMIAILPLCFFAIYRILHRIHLLRKEAEEGE